MSNENKILSEDEGSTEPVPHPTPDTHTNPSESAYDGTRSYSPRFRHYSDYIELSDSHRGSLINKVEHIRTFEHLKGAIAKANNAEPVLIFWSNKCFAINAHIGCSGIPLHILNK